MLFYMQWRVILYILRNIYSYRLWNYNANNSVKHGDHWNGEDFSIFNEQHHARQRTKSNKRNKSPVRPTVKDSHDTTALTSVSQPLSPHSPFDLPLDHYFKGGRVLEAVIRPYATRIAGEPVNQYFKMNTMEYYLEFKNPLGNENSIMAFVNNTVETIAPSRKQSIANLETMHNETLIYVPKFQYEQFEVEIYVSDGTFDYNKELQTISYKHKINLPGYKHWLMVKVVQSSWLCCQ